ncbi:hypothetical protein FH972_021148 [Carpinus fangiana]|uniref:DNA-directed RNA polymerase RBP11-like dimerisation domain-containing protein n=1 Tax=Carpinus fangiana TaxID=176857 RepID=A0A5N6KP37_9ROSI|nr:hypothetical protein FH972_021148 [Carpinus fangiana]
MSNAPDRFELFYTEPGQPKIEIQPETRVPNACIFKFIKEDHTLANLLRARLLQSPSVVFAAYKVPHPLFPDFELRVQTDGSITPKDALLQACKDIVGDLGGLSREFTKEWEIAKAVAGGRPDGL